MPYETNVPLLTASSFAILAGSGITFAGAVNSTTINGNIGTYPTATITGIGNAVLNGTNHAGDAVTQQAKLDLTAAYLFAAAATGAVTVPTELGSTTKTPGVYNSAAGTFGITGTLTLDAQGDPNAVFIFQAASTLITAASSNVVLINGAQAANVFWQVGTSATLGASSHLEGTILALTAITVTTSATANGRLLARNGAVTLDTNTVTVTESSSVNPNTLVGAGSGAGTFCAAQCLDNHSKLAFLIYFMAAELKAMGGTNYLASDGSILRNTLNLDADIFNNYSADQLGVGPVGMYVGIATVVSAYDNANANGANLPTDVNAMAILVAGLRNMNDRQLAQAFLLLLVKLGRHAAYPQ
jgi:uncharacterized Zn-binding protein involved in type VI secretion